MPQVTITNPRLTATADLQLQDGVKISVSFERSDSELQVLQRVKDEITKASAVRVAAGEPELMIPKDEDLVPVLGILNRMKDQVRDVSV